MGPSRTDPGRSRCRCSSPSPLRSEGGDAGRRTGRDEAAPIPAATVLAQFAAACLGMVGFCAVQVKLPSTGGWPCKALWAASLVASPGSSLKIVVANRCDQLRDGHHGTRRDDAEDARVQRRPGEPQRDQGPRVPRRIFQMSPCSSDVIIASTLNPRSADRTHSATPGCTGPSGIFWPPNASEPSRAYLTITGGCPSRDSTASGMLGRAIPGSLSSVASRPYILQSRISALGRPIFRCDTSAVSGRRPPRGVKHP